MFQNVGGALSGFLEINRNGHSAISGDGEVRGMPFWTVRCEQADSVSGFYAKFKQCLRQSSSAAKQFVAGNILPACGLRAAKHLSAWARPRIEGVEKFGGKRPVVHCLTPLYSSGRGGATRQM